jgi:hypothetical protein
MNTTVRLTCLICADRPLFVGYAAGQAHFQGHRMVGDQVQASWTCPNGLMLKRAVPSTRPPRWSC